MNFKRIFVLILDSLGVGEANDANEYNDTGANTLKHIIEKHDLFIPNLKKLGFLNTINMDDNDNVDAYYTIARPTNVGKDSVSGHYEIIGLDSKKPFKNFSETAFPIELIDIIERSLEKRLIGNKVIDGEQVFEVTVSYTSEGNIVYYNTQVFMGQVQLFEYGDNSYFTYVNMNMPVYLFAIENTGAENASIEITVSIAEMEF